VRSFTRMKPVRARFPAHLPRERVVIPAPGCLPVPRSKCNFEAAVGPR